MDIHSNGAGTLFSSTENRDRTIYTYSLGLCQLCPKQMRYQTALHLVFASLLPSNGSPNYRSYHWNGQPTLTLGDLTSLWNFSPTINLIISAVEHIPEEENAIYDNKWKMLAERKKERKKTSVRCLCKSTKIHCNASSLVSTWSLFNSLKSITITIKCCQKTY